MSDANDWMDVAADMGRLLATAGERIGVLNKENARLRADLDAARAEAATQRIRIADLEHERDEEYREAAMYEDERDTARRERDEAVEVLRQFSAGAYEREALAFLAAHDARARSIDAAIEASSLGSPEAKAIRASADPEQVGEVLQRIRERDEEAKLLALEWQARGKEPPPSTPTCKQCGKRPVEKERATWATPVCFDCVPQFAAERSRGEEDP